MSHGSELVGASASNVVDFRNFDISSPSDFKEFQKKVKENAQNIVFLLLHNAVVRPEYSLPLFASLKRASHLEAFDVSGNALRAPFEQALTDYLKVYMVDSCSGHAFLPLIPALTPSYRF
jgi:hypothetical protein